MDESIIYLTRDAKRRHSKSCYNEVSFRHVKFVVPSGQPGENVCVKGYLWKLLEVTGTSHRKDIVNEHQWVTDYNCKGNGSLNWFKNRTVPVIRK